MELKNEYLRQCRAATSQLLDEWTQIRNILVSWCPNHRRHFVRRPADWIPGAEYKQVLAGKNSSESTINVPSLKLWQQTMKEHRETKLAIKDKSSMPTTTDTHQTQGSRFVNNEMKCNERMKWWEDPPCVTIYRHLSIIFRRASWQSMSLAIVYL
jgi:hypothetical protein